MQLNIEGGVDLFNITNFRTREALRRLAVAPKLFELQKDKNFYKPWLDKIIVTENQIGNLIKELQLKDIKTWCLQKVKAKRAASLRRRFKRRMALRARLKNQEINEVYRQQRVKEQESLKKELKAKASPEEQHELVILIKMIEEDLSSMIDAFAKKMLPTLKNLKIGGKSIFASLTDSEIYDFNKKFVHTSLNTPELGQVERKTIRASAKAKFLRAAKKLRNLKKNELKQKSVFKWQQASFELVQENKKLNQKRKDLYNDVWKKCKPENASDLTKDEAAELGMQMRDFLRVIFPKLQANHKAVEELKPVVENLDHELNNKNVTFAPKPHQMPALCA